MEILCTDVRSRKSECEREREREREREGEGEGERTTLFSDYPTRMRKTGSINPSLITPLLIKSGV